MGRVVESVFCVGCGEFQGEAFAPADDIICNHCLPEYKEILKDETISNENDSDAPRRVD